MIQIPFGGFQLVTGIHSRMAWKIPLMDSHWGYPHGYGNPPFLFPLLHKISKWPVSHRQHGPLFCQVFRRPEIFPESQRNGGEIPKFESWGLVVNPTELPMILGDFLKICCFNSDFWNYTFMSDIHRYSQTHHHPTVVSMNYIPIMCAEKTKTKNQIFMRK